MTVKTSTGTLLSVVKGQPATYNEAGYSALSFVEVGEVTDIPEYGPTTTTVTHEPLATGITQKLKGFIDYGSVSLGLGYDTTDAGQAILSEGVDGTGQFDEHSFMIEYSDGEVDYFTAQIFSCTKNPSTSNSVVASTVSIEINTSITTVTP